MKTFYIDPPGNDASPEEWENWLKREKRAEAVEKAKITKAQEHTDISEMPHFVPGGVSKVNGRYTQQSVGYALGGDFESGDGTFDLLSPAIQGNYFQQRGKRTRLKAKAHNAKRRKARNAARVKRFKRM